MIEIAGGILLALLVLVLLPWVLVGLSVAFWMAVAVVFVALTIAYPSLVLLWLALACLVFIYWLGEDKERWDAFWRFRKR
jgi:hypothetical protein